MTSTFIPLTPATLSAAGGPAAYDSTSAGYTSSDISPSSGTQLPNASDGITQALDPHTFDISLVDSTTKVLLHDTYVRIGVRVSGGAAGATMLPHSLPWNALGHFIQGVTLRVNDQTDVVRITSGYSKAFTSYFLSNYAADELDSHPALFTPVLIGSNSQTDAYANTDAVPTNTALIRANNWSAATGANGAINYHHVMEIPLHDLLLMTELPPITYLNIRKLTLTITWASPPYVIAAADPIHPTSNRVWLLDGVRAGDATDAICWVSGASIRLGTVRLTASKQTEIATQRVNGEADDLLAFYSPVVNTVTNWVSGSPITITSSTNLALLHIFQDSSVTEGSTAVGGYKASYFYGDIFLADNAGGSGQSYLISRGARPNTQLDLGTGAVPFLDTCQVKYGEFVLPATPLQLSTGTAPRLHSYYANNLTALGCSTHVRRAPYAVHAARTRQELWFRFGLDTITSAGMTTDNVLVTLNFGTKGNAADQLTLVEYRMRLFRIRANGAIESLTPE